MESPEALTSGCCCTSESLSEMSDNANIDINYSPPQIFSVVLTEHPQVKAYLQIGSIILGDKWTVALAQNCDFLLNVLDVVLCFLQVNNFNGNNFLSPIVNSLIDLAERAFSDPLQLGEKLLWVCFEILGDRRKDF